MHRLHEAGIHVVLHTARIAPVTPFGEKRPVDEVTAEIESIRELLDEGELGFMPIHNFPWKPSSSGYLDDKAIPYAGDWKTLTSRLLTEFGQPTSPFPPFL